MANPDLPTGARGSSNASLAGDAPESIPAPIKLQAIPEREAEPLAFGYGMLDTVSTEVLIEECERRGLRVEATDA